MAKVLNVPKVQLALTLLIISIYVLTTNPSIQSLTLIFGSLISSVGFDLLFTYLRRRKFFIPWAAVVSGLIIGLIIDPTAEFWKILIITGLAMAIKNFIRIGNRHIFNPASAGLVLGGALLSMPVAWWGVNSQSGSSISFANLPALAVVLIPAFVSAYKLGRYGSILSFLIIYVIMQVIQNPSFNLESILGAVFNPSVLFFSIVMLPEPMTSPIKIKRQLFYGAFVAIMVSALSFIFLSNEFSAQIFLIDPLLITLLLANLIFFKYR